jgi:hypothetical protein
MLKSIANVVLVHDGWIMLEEESPTAEAVAADRDDDICRAVNVFDKARMDAVVSGASTAGPVMWTRLRVPRILKPSMMDGP